MDINTALDLSDIICAAIQALGSIAAMVSSALIARKVVKENIKPLFQSYYDKSYDFSNVIAIVFCSNSAAVPGEVALGV